MEEEEQVREPHGGTQIIQYVPGAVGEARIPIQDAIFSSTRPPPPAQVGIPDNRRDATVPASSRIRHLRHLRHDSEILID